MKTVFISINRGLLARNILRTDVFKILKDHANIRIVLFLPPKIAPYIREEFEIPGKVILEEMHPFKYGAFRRFIFLPFLWGLLFTDTTKMIYKYGSARVRRLSLISYWFRYAIFTILKPFHGVKKFFRYIESEWYKDWTFVPYFDKYKPDLVFTPTILSVSDVALLKIANPFWMSFH